MLRGPRGVAPAITRANSLPVAAAAGQIARSAKGHCCRRSPRSRPSQHRSQPQHRSLQPQHGVLPAARPHLPLYAPALGVAPGARHQADRGSECRGRRDDPAPSAASADTRLAAAPRRQGLAHRVPREAVDPRHRAGARPLGPAAMQEQAPSRVALPPTRQPSARPALTAGARPRGGGAAGAVLPRGARPGWQLDHLPRRLSHQCAACHTPHCQLPALPALRPSSSPRCQALPAPQHCLGRRRCSEQGPGCGRLSCRAACRRRATGVGGGGGLRAGRGHPGLAGPATVAEDGGGWAPACWRHQAQLAADKPTSGRQAAPHTHARSSARAARRACHQGPSARRRAAGGHRVRLPVPAAAQAGGAAAAQGQPQAVAAAQEAGSHGQPGAQAAPAPGALQLGAGSRGQRCTPRWPGLRMAACCGAELACCHCGTVWSSTA
jgi:hypothetical protein